jgi:acyl transferase domain-containing protein/SAM-dependent methyltransferase
MASGLYNTESTVRDAIDRCARLLKPKLGADIRRLLFPTQRRKKDAAEALKDTRWAQPALVTVGYALAELWRSWGVQPAAMIGHSVGEYVAAVLSGVMDLPDALALIARRGQLISALPRGSMLAVMAPADRLERFVNGDIALAAVNAPGFSVLSGTREAIEGVEHVLERESVVARRLHTSHAFHSAMMDPILREFEDLVSGVKLSKPNLPFVATLNGAWADGPVTKPQYWSAQLRSTVRFADAMHTLAESSGFAGRDPIYLEVGPGRTLATFAAENNGTNGKSPLCLNSLPGPEDHRSDTEVALLGLGQLWSRGVDIDWRGFHQSERRMRVSLPTYPFERQSYWVGPVPGVAAPAAEARDTANWFYRLEWREGELLKTEDAQLSGHRILVFDEQTGIGAGVIQSLKDAGAQPIIVRQGKEYSLLGDDVYTLNPAQAEGYKKLADHVCTNGTRLAGVIDCWSAAPPAETDLDAAAVVSLLGPMRLARALSEQNTMRPLHVLLVVRGTTQVLPTDEIDATRALSLGPAKVVPQEHPGFRIAHIDVDNHNSVPQQIVAELATGASEPAVALRGGNRYVEIQDATPIPAAGVPHNLPERPVVVITGGLGHMGMSLAEGLFTHLGARLVLMGRSAMPPPNEWRPRSEDQRATPEARKLLGRLAHMHEQRDEVMVVNADFNQKAQVRAGVDEAIARFGQIDMVIHGAARIDAAAFASVAETTTAVVEAQFSPKLRGLFHLMDALRGREPSRWVLHSSISSVLGGLGLGVYSGANAVLDALAQKGGDNWLSVDWDAWDNAAEAEVGSMPAAIVADEGKDAFLRLLSVDVGRRVLVVVNDLAGRMKAWVRRADTDSSPSTAVANHPRPSLSNPFVEPRTDTERSLAEIWSAQLGVVPIGIHDKFFELGGHSLLAVQISSQIRDRFQVEMPVLKMFQAPTVAELAAMIDKAIASSAGGNEAPKEDAAALTQTTDEGSNAPISGEAPAVAAKAGYRDFYNNITRQLERSGVGEASFFLNYGYLSSGEGDEAPAAVPDGIFNPNSVRLAFELIGSTDLRKKNVLDVGCGRGGTVALLAEHFAAEASGIDLAPEAVAFCRKTHKQAVRFEVGDAEHLPFEKATFDVVTNIESSHTYPNLRAFYAEVARVLASHGRFLYTDLLPVERWMEVRALLGPLGLKILTDRHITRNVLASCDEISATRAKAFGGSNELIDNFLAVPGSAVYEQMRSGAWEYRIVRAERV